MRTRIEIDDELLFEAAQYAHATSVSGIIDEALRLFVERRRLQKSCEIYALRTRALRVQMAKMILPESSITLLRADRSSVS